MDQEQFNRHLIDVPNSPQQQKIVNQIVHSIKNAAMCSDDRTQGWAEADRLYRGYRHHDKKDREDVANKQPPKIIIPLSYALIQTSLAFLMTTFFGQERLYRLRGSGPEDRRRKEAYELDIEYQLNKEKAILKFYLWMQDAFKYGVGILESSWEEKYQQFRVRQSVESSMIKKAYEALTGGSSSETYEEVVQSLKVFEGTTFRNINPYNFYSDPNVPLARLQEGAFVICEDETSLTELKSKENTVYYGTEHIDKYMSMSTFEQRSHRVGKNTIFSNIRAGSGQFSSKGINLTSGCIKTRYEFVSTPRELKEDFDYDIDPTYDINSQIKMVAVCANDQKVIKFQPLGYLHNKFCYDVIEYSPDEANHYNPGLIDTIYELEHRMTWYLNSQAQNVKKAIQNRIIVNDKVINTEDLASGKHYIRTRQNVTSPDLKKAIYSFEVNDMTRGHINDIQVLQSFAQMSTGVSDAALSKFNTGRRSAREAGQVDNAHGARVTMHGRLFWAMGFEPLGQKLVANTNQLRSEKYYNNIIGEDIARFPFSEIIQMDPESIANGFDFIQYEGHTASDREKEAYHLTELLKPMMGNPSEISALTGYDLSKLIKQVYSLYGIKNMDDYKVSPEQLQQKLEATVVPDEKLAQTQNELQQVTMPDEILKSLSQ